jgi:hypothetical protein
MSWAVDDAPTPQRPAGWVAALLEERRGYVLRNLADRVAQVDAELARYGVAVETTEVVASADLETSEVKRGPGRPRKPID